MACAFSTVLEIFTLLDEHSILEGRLTCDVVEKLTIGKKQPCFPIP